MSKTYLLYLSFFPFFGLRLPSPDLHTCNSWTFWDGICKHLIRCAHKTDRDTESERCIGGFNSEEVVGFQSAYDHHWFEENNGTAEIQNSFVSKCVSLFTVKVKNPPSVVTAKSPFLLRRPQWPIEEIHSSAVQNVVTRFEECVSHPPISLSGEPTLLWQEGGVSWKVTVVPARPNTD